MFQNIDFKNISVQPFFFGDDLSNLYSFLKDSPFIAFYRDYLKEKRFKSSSDIAGIIMIDKRQNNFIGCTLLITHDENGLIVGNISCTYISDCYRGNSLSSYLINESKKYCDVVTNLTPVDSIIRTIKKRKVVDFRPICKYQEWIRPKKRLFKKMKTFKILPFETKESLFIENKANSISFKMIQLNDEVVVVGYYSFRRFWFKCVEVVYVSNPSLLSTYKMQICSLIRTAEKCSIVFLDSIFIGDKTTNKKIFKNKKNTLSYIFRLFYLCFKREIYLSNRKYFWMKDGVIWSPNYLSSELCFYK